jgi:hypothetical protein
VSDDDYRPYLEYGRALGVASGAIRVAVEWEEAEAKLQAILQRAAAASAVSLEKMRAHFEEALTSVRGLDRPALSERTLSALRGYSAGRAWLDEIASYGRPETPYEVGERVRAHYLETGHLLPQEAGGTNDREASSA